MKNAPDDECQEALLQEIFVSAVHDFEEAVKSQQAHQAYLAALPWWHRERLMSFLDHHPGLVEAVICALGFLAFEMALVTLLYVCQIRLRP